MAEETSHPSAKMVTINRPAFWFFMAACVLLYIYNKATTSVVNLTIGYQANEVFIIAAVFVGLFLNIVSVANRLSALTKTLNIVCYTFEITSIVLIILKIVFD
jgi:hypothetical protein